ncbi:MAG TPA: cyclic nucleotide-binding domain-containing protein [Roseiarcus sp.]|jgi:CRP/FNR family transcriptional regulator
MFSSFRNASVPTIVPAEQGPTLRDLFKGQPTVEYSAGEPIFWEGDPAGQIFDIADGVLRVYKVLARGRRAIVGFIHPGDVLGVSFQSRYLFTAQAVTDVKVRRFPRRRFFSLINESPALRPQLFALLCDEMSAAQDQMLLLRHRSAEERVASFLLAVHRKSAVGNNIQLQMGRLDMADYLGLTIETVSRIMTSLTRRGLIVAAGRQSLTLRKPNTLREIAGSDDWEDAEPESPSARRAVWPD